MRSDNAQEAIIAAILGERRAQDEKWGVDRDLPDHAWMTILTEEVGEVARAILEHDEDGWRSELVQVAAVAVATLEALNRRALA